jgi:phthiocerol/phenolphthiocerol synthesis type-I polyketide synthase E
VALDDTRSAIPLGIAIIGFAGRFPGSPSVETFWRNLRDGTESIVPLSDADLEAHGINRFTFNAPGYVKAAAALEGCEDFDASYFRIDAQEAELMDPQHRIFLECAVETMENAGYDPLRYPGSIGVYGGTGINTYLTPNGAESDVAHTMVVVGNDKDYVATRVSYKLNLRGPSLTVQTACSTSLVAIHLACQSLLMGESDMALAGGVSVSNHVNRGYFHTEGGMVSPDGHCRPFDADAQGTVFGDGVGIVLLKRLDRALADGDHIRAVIKGSAVNNDGLDKAGFTAPSINRQAAVVAEALAVADISPDTIGYIEAHGTGTSLGDPIEVAALTQVFRAATDRTGFCGIGSVKANIGHLNAAAGVAGLIKVILALEHEMLPPLINFRAPNPQIDFAGSPFTVIAEPTRWPRGAVPRRAGISSFGIGGTNAHLVLEEAPRRLPAQSPPSNRPAELLVLSARSPEAVDSIARDLAARLRQNTALCLADVAFTLNTGRNR